MSGRLQMATWMFMILYFVWQLSLANSLRYIKVGWVGSVSKISELTGSCSRKLSDKIIIFYYKGFRIEGLHNTALLWSGMPIAPPGAEAATSGKELQVDCKQGRLKPRRRRLIGRQFGSCPVWMSPWCDLCQSDTLHSGNCRNNAWSRPWPLPRIYNELLSIILPLYIVYAVRFYQVFADVRKGTKT